ncbi:dienelactone hydrolase family protein [Phenylobacterium sp.]|uniref:dienelactone hydrolase family protein n=1 Tax=Phenylobacterium sp. TaxID=1871053 RepID=UPI002ED7B22D
MPEARIEIELDEGALDAFVACPDAPGRRPPILLLPDRLGVTLQAESRARRLSAHNYFVLAPDLSGVSADDCHEAVSACLDHLADAPGADDKRVGILGFGAGADLALSLAAFRSERIAAVAAYAGRGFTLRTTLEIASRINGVVRIGYAFGAVSPRVGRLETALSAAGVDFDVEVGDGEPDWSGLLDFFARALEPAGAALPNEVARQPAALNP